MKVELAMVPQEHVVKETAAGVGGHEVAPSAGHRYTAAPTWGWPVPDTVPEGSRLWVRDTGQACPGGPRSSGTSWPRTCFAHEHTALRDSAHILSAHVEADEEEHLHGPEVGGAGALAGGKSLTRRGGSPRGG